MDTIKFNIDPITAVLLEKNVPVINECIKLPNALYINGSINGTHAAKILNERLGNVDHEYMGDYKKAKATYDKLTNLGIKESLIQLYSTNVIEEYGELKEAVESFLESHGNTPEYKIASDYLQFAQKYSLIREVTAVSESVVQSINKYAPVIALLNAGYEKEVAGAMYENDHITALLDNPNKGITKILEQHGIRRKLEVYDRLSPIYESQSGNTRFLMNNRLYEATDDSIFQLPVGTPIPDSFLETCDVFGQLYDIKSNKLVIEVKESKIVCDPIKKTVDINGNIHENNGYAKLMPYVGSNIANALKEAIESNKYKHISKTIFLENKVVDIFNTNGNYYLVESTSTHTTWSKPMSIDEMYDTLEKQYNVVEKDIAIEDEEEYDVEIDDTDMEEMGMLDNTIDDLTVELEEVEDNLDQLDGYYDDEEVEEARRRLMESKRILSTKLKMVKVLRNPVKSYESIMDGITKVGDTNSSMGPAGTITVVATTNGIKILCETLAGGVRGIPKLVPGVLPDVTTARNAISRVSVALKEQEKDIDSVTVKYLDYLTDMDHEAALEKVCQECDLDKKYVVDMLSERGCIDEENKVVRKLKDLDSKLDSILSSKEVEVMEGKYRGLTLPLIRIDGASRMLVCEHNNGLVYIDQSEI